MRSGNTGPEDSIWICDGALAGALKAYACLAVVYSDELWQFECLWLNRALAVILLTVLLCRKA